MSSDQVSVGDIPREPPAYQPRAGLLASLDRPDAASPTVHVLIGPPGAGKTQLAAAYTRAKLAQGWRLAAWVDAGTAGTLLAGLAAVADAAGLPDGGPGWDTADAGLAVRRRLEADGDRCLLVLDGADDWAALRPFVPASGAAHVLITATRLEGTSPGTIVPVSVVKPEEAVAYLVGRTGLRDDEGASAVAAELKYLPLALAQAAAVIAARHLEYPAYLERLRSTSVGPEPAREGQEQVSPQPTGAVKAAWLSLDVARQADRTGVSTRVLALMAVLSASGVRRELLYGAGQAGVLAPGRRRMAASAVDEALADLAGRSLLTSSLDGRTVVMHPVVAEVARSWLARHGQLAAASQAAAAVLEARALALDATRDRPAVRDLPEQVAALLSHAAGPAGPVGDELASELIRLRFLALYHLIELGDSAAQAVAVGEPLTADLEQMLGPDDPDTLNARNSLAAAYLAAGRTTEAVRLFERTLVRQQQTLGPNHPDTLTSQNNLAATYQDIGRLDEAILLFKLTLAARERLLGADHLSTLSSRGNLAAAYRAAGRAAEAIPLLEQTLAGREKVLGAGHPDTRAAGNRLDQALRDADRPPAEPPVVELPQLEVPDLLVDLASEPQAIAAGEAVSQEEVPAQETAAGEEEPQTAKAPEETAEEQTTAAAEPVGAPETENDSSSEPVPAPGPEPDIPRPRPSDSSGRPAAGPHPRRPVRLPWVAAAVLALIVASGVVGALSRLHSVGHSAEHGRPVRAKTANAAQMAADWVAQQVSHSVTVACDPIMCAALEARGVPTARLLVLRTDAASPRGAAVVVATPAVRSQFGSRLDSEYAPSVLAGFGSGPGQVNVRVVAPDGVAAYRTALRQDQAARKAAGTQLLANKQIGETSQARAQLTAGEVDSRLLILLPALAATHPIQVLAFADSGPGASPGMPLCSADLSGSGRAADMTDAAYQHWLTSFIRPQLVRFAGSVTVVRQGGQTVVRVQFVRPSPLGLLSG